MSQIVTKAQMDAKRGWQSSDKTAETSEDLAEYNKLRHSTIKIEIVGQLVFEEVVRHKLVQLAKQIRKEENEDEKIDDNRYFTYGAALRHLQ